MGAAYKLVNQQEFGIDTSARNKKYIEKMLKEYAVMISKSSKAKKVF